ncbi:hypothetical protein [Aneurinibacillus tyrosinisolvens]|uniref:hypothetical protein n=1 Tax=Aneurinibacillus tyrosinisolvens TaxID=1443435 RepID=UPI00063F5597|nr:hypothetical protein [Aneurinibacillus tyrosinisolvens]
MKKLAVPFLSLAVLFPSASNVFAAPHTPAPIDKVEFIGMKAPQTPEEINTMYSKASAEVTYKNGTKKYSL